mmetsp:Transcript_62358/g.134126  ORF Transcript_62358/g.134126 Transcript_62358/m.134126 type:complete len:332 (+) Transcript_62358:254-1249(+)
MPTSPPQPPGLRADAAIPPEAPRRCSWRPPEAFPPQTATPGAAIAIPPSGPRLPRLLAKDHAAHLAHAPLWLQLPPPLWPRAEGAPPPTFDSQDSRAPFPERAKPHAPAQRPQRCGRALPAPPSFGAPPPPGAVLHPDTRHSRRITSPAAPPVLPWPLLPSVCSPQRHELPRPGVPQPFAPALRPPSSSWSGRAAPFAASPTQHVAPWPQLGSRHVPLMLSPPELLVLRAGAVSPVVALLRKAHLSQSSSQRHRAPPKERPTPACSALAPPAAPRLQPPGVYALVLSSPAQPLAPRAGPAPPPAWPSSPPPVPPRDLASPFAVARCHLAAF